MLIPSEFVDQSTYVIVYLMDKLVVGVRNEMMVGVSGFSVHLNVQISAFLTRTEQSKQVLCAFLSETSDFFHFPCVIQPMCGCSSREGCQGSVFLLFQVWIGHYGGHS